MTVVAGDIAFVGVNSSDPDQFAFLALNPIAAGDSFFVTDGGITGTGGAASSFFRASEGFLQYTAPTGGVAAGSVILVNVATLAASRNGGGLGGNVVALGNGNSGSPITAPALSTSGDQLTAYTVSAGTHLTGTPNLIAFIDFGSAASYANNTTSSNTPAIAGGQVLDLGNLDNAIFTDAAQVASASLGALSLPSNFVQRETTAYDLTALTSGGGGAVTVTVNDVGVAEGDAGTALLTFTITRSDNSGAFTLDWATADGTATTADGDYVAASGQLSFAAGGALSQQVSVTINGDASVEPDETLTLALANLVNASGAASIADASGTGTILNDDVVLTEIAAIQGAGHRSPFVGGAIGTVANSGATRVSAEGVVTGITTNGFWIQDPTPDADAGTSDGIFVFTSAAPAAGIAVGATVRVLNARVDEFRVGSASNNLTLTELNAAVSGASVVDLGGSSAIAPVVLGPGGREIPTGAISSAGFATYDPAAYAIDLWESLEGMLVRIDNPVTVSPTFEFRTQLDATTAGPPTEEIWVVPTGGFDAASQTPRGGLIIGPTDYNPERIQIDDMLAALDLPSVSVGAGLSAVTGVVHYDFGNYEVQVATAPTVVAASPLAPETTALTRSIRQITIADYNVENLDPKVEDVASVGLSNSDDDLGSGKYAAHAQHIAVALGAPTIVALQEIQDNDGAEASGVSDADVTLQTLIDLIQATYGITYKYAQISPASNTTGGQPNANIRNAFLYREDQVTLDGLSLIDGPAFNNSRRPLVGEFTFNGQALVVINTHFSSKGGDNALFGNVQPPVLGSETQRLAQTQAVNDYVDGLLAADPGALVKVVGDINDFTFSAPFRALTGEATGNQVLFDLAEALLPANERYTYNFEGNTQELDHQLASAALLGTAAPAFDIVHVNSEFYGAVSDHDPSVSRYDFTALAENLVLTAGADSVDGAGGADTIAGQAGNDTLLGGTGNDSLLGGAADDRLDGGSGADAMAGGTGDDTYVVDNAGDGVTEAAGEGTDTVVSTLSRVLGANLENLVLLGSRNLRGGGNELANALTGNAGDNALFGYAGNDTLTGGAGKDALSGGAGNDLLEGGEGDDRLLGQAGNDTLTGGTGADSFVFQGRRGSDVVTDFTVGVDRIQLSNTSLHSFAEVLAAAQDVGPDLRIALPGPGGNVILLLGVQEAQLMAGDFVF